MFKLIAFVALAAITIAVAAADAADSGRAGARAAAAPAPAIAAPAAPVASHAAPTAPATPAGRRRVCDRNYSGRCLNPSARDYDCAGGSGDGPRYVRGPFRVVGSDRFRLDADGDGIACESS